MTVVPFIIQPRKRLASSEYPLPHKAKHQKQEKQQRSTYLVEARHGLVGAADLDLVKGGLAAVARGTGALDFCLVGVVPGSRSAKDVLALLLLEDAPREEGLLDGVLVRARPALEAVPARLAGRGDCEDVGAAGADFFVVRVSITF